MAEVFVRRTTAFLIALVFALTLVCVAVIVLLYVGSEEKDAEHFTPVTHPERKVMAGSRRGRKNPLYESDSGGKLGSEPGETANSAPDGMQQHPWERNIRIPETTIPYHYDLLLHPDLETERFSGHVSILIGVTSTMDYLLTHVKFMNVTSTQLVDQNSGVVGLQETFEYEPNQFWVVRPKSELLPGNYSLALEFNGGLKGHIVGFYMSEYTTKSGEKRKIASSKFQPTDARRAFPCFDEPSFKSTFATRLVRPSGGGYIALSNMPVQSETADAPLPGLTTVAFAPSVPMVTYLACFIVCDFDYVQANTDRNKPFRVYSTKDQINRTHYARDIGVNVLNYFERYFEVEYPLPKQDMIAIPDFSSGAMEHWGLITYREVNALYDDVDSSSFNKFRVASVIAHELAHMWFGNLVTLKWWDDLWLNEGFASYMEYRGVSSYEKDWDMGDQFLSSDLHRVFRLDQILASHPIVQPVNHPDEITEIFDAISYSKGASVLRMLEDFLGEEHFRVGVRNFLRKFKYGSAVTQDLWNELQATLAPSQNLNITRIMDTWTRQMGFPVLTVKTSKNNESQLEVEQERFLIDPEAKSGDDSPLGYRWDIPVTVRTSGDAKKELHWFNMEQAALTLNHPSDADWVKLNVDQFGYYRVNYDDHLWTRLIHVLNNNHQSLSPSDRANLVDDAFSLAGGALLPYDTAFRLLAYLPRETHFVPSYTAAKHLNDVGSLLQNTVAYRLFRKYVVNLVDKHVSRVGWEDTGSHLERRNRAVILSLACTNGHRGCLEGAVTKFRAWIQDPNYVIPANLRKLVYTFGIKETGEHEWNVLLERYSKELNAQEISKMLDGLASTQQPWIANSFLNIARDLKTVRKQDFFLMLNKFTGNPAALSVVWKFARNNWEWMVETFGLNNRYMGRMIKKIGYQFTSPLELKELQAFFEEYPNAGAGKRSRQQALEKVHQNIKWIQSYAKPLHMWLGNNAL